jgi:hypothetical protein
LRWFVIDAIPISDIDVNGLYALRDLNVELGARGATLIMAGRRTEFLIWLRDIGVFRTELDNRLFPTLSQARNNAGIAAVPTKLSQFLEGSSGVKPGLPPWGPHVRFRRVQTLVREGSPLVKLRNSA